MLLLTLLPICNSKGQKTKKTLLCTSLTDRKHFFVCYIKRLNINALSDVFKILLTNALKVDYQNLCFLSLIVNCLTITTSLILRVRLRPRSHFTKYHIYLLSFPPFNGNKQQYIHLYNKTSSLNLVIV